MPLIPPLSIRRTGDDSPVASVWAYTIRMTGWRQLLACLLAIGVAALNLAPIEIQRRMVDDAMRELDSALLVGLGGVYLAILLTHQVAKLALGVLQGWLGESAIIYTRRHLLELDRARRQGHDEDAGQTVSIVGTEVDKLGGFVGSGPSQACANLSIVVGVVGYMAVVEPRIAIFSLVLLVPQIALAPVLQSRLNRLVENRLAMLRELGDAIAGAEIPSETETSSLLGRIYANRISFYLWKLAMKAGLNLLNGLVPLSVLLLGGWLVIAGDTTIGVIVAFLSGFDRISGPIRDLIGLYRAAAQAEVQHRMIAQWM